MILCEQPDGIAWIVAHDTDTGAVVITPALPEWADAELVAAWDDGLLASVAGLCPECGAARPPASPAVAPLPHDPACRMSGESVTRMEKACRPPGRRWVVDERQETLDAIVAYCRDLTENLERS